MIIDGKEWKLVPVDPPESAIDDACRRNWRKTLAAAPAPPVVEVTDDVAKAVLMAFADFPVRLRNAWTGQDMIAAVQSILGPTLGLVPREDVARMVEAAYRECASELCHYDTALVDQWWAESDARKRLEGWR